MVFPVTDQSALANPFHIDLMRGAGVALRSADYTMMVAIAETEERLLETVKSMVTQSKVHNFLSLYTKEKDPVTDYLRDAGMNFVVIGRPEKQGDRFVDAERRSGRFFQRPESCWTTTTVSTWLSLPRRTTGPLKSTAG
ncbi:hypothetical protein ACW180_09635 [Limosilactobacillus fermentum]